MATNSKSSNLSKPKPGIGAGPSSSKPKIDASTSKKKTFEGSIKSSATDAKNRSISSGSKMTKNTPTQKKDERNQQPNPDRRKFILWQARSLMFRKSLQREPLRIFYESLSKQIPSSEMAEFWLMEHGMLSPDRAKKAYEKKQRKQKQLRNSTPIKSPPPSTSSRPESSKRLQPVPKNGEAKAKKRLMDSDDDDDFVLSHKRRKG